MSDAIYGNKAPRYFEGIREDIIALIPQGKHKILDVGSGSGNMGLALKEHGKATEVIGVELCEPYAEEANRKIDMVVHGDIENIELSFPEGYFDYIVCGDIIEHLVDPWATLRKLRKYLSNSGYIVASIPNVRYWRIIKDLVLFGEWKYQAEGILDRTHLRFFTAKGMSELFNSADFKVDKIICDVGGKSKMFNIITGALFIEFLAWRFYILASKSEAGG